MTNSSIPPTTATPPSSPPTSQPSTDPSTAPHSTPDPSTAPPASAFLLPTFEYIPHIPLSDSSIEAFIKAFIQPTQLHAHHATLTRAQQNLLKREPELRAQFPVRKVDDVLVLICGHGGRDQRCGILGPILQAEFEDKLARQNIRVLRGAPDAEAEDRSGVAVEAGQEGYLPAARVALISHIGGHKFAGNVIVYIPESWAGHALAGKGIWYGRVEPAHVEGIVAKTVIDGKVIMDHFRGGVGQGGEIMRL